MGTPGSSSPRVPSSKTIRDTTRQYATLRGRSNRPDPMVFSPDSRSNDADLLRESQAGDERATEAILAKHLPGLRAYVQLHMNPVLRARESASDLVQSACRELVRS